MAGPQSFCRFSNDVRGCQASLAEAGDNGTVAQHCVMTGLKADWPQCKGVLLTQLSSRGSAKAGTSPGSGQGSGGLTTACETAVLLGYKLALPPAMRLFHDAHTGLIRWMAHNCGLQDDSDPSADDVCQTVFKDMHPLLSRGGLELRSGRLATYVRTAAVRVCAEFLRMRKAREAANEILEEALPRPGAVPRYVALWIPMEVVEKWKDLDERLLRTGQGRLANRVILAHMCVEGQASRAEYLPKELHADWARLRARPEEETRRLYEEVAAEAGRLPQLGPVAVTVDVLNACVAELWQLPVVFPATAMESYEKTQELLDELAALSTGAIAVARHRIVAALRATKREDE